MMATHIYSGPADHLIVDGKLYHPGDAVPVTADQRASLELNGHRFADSDEAAVAQAIAERPAPVPDSMPRDDRGAPMVMPDARKAPADPSIAPPARAAKADA